MLASKREITGPVNVAVVMTEGATVIDFAGPWEVFQDVDHSPGFHLYTVGDSTEMIRATAGLQIVPSYTYATAPPPRIVVAGAQSGRSPELLEWLRRVSKTADLMMSVCTGAFLYGAAGLLDGLSATTHHDFYDEFARRFPKVKLVRNRRFVESERVITAGGLTSGIDCALHVVARYFGDDVAARTAEYMEYQSTAWRT